MYTQPSIIVFEADEPIHSQLLSLFQKVPFRLAFVNSLAALYELVDSTGTDTDCFVIPALLSGGRSGIGMVAQLRAEETFADVPILSITSGGEKQTAVAHFSSGADVVLSLPVEPDLMHEQILALVRQRRFFTSQLDRMLERTELSHGAMHGLDATRDALLVLDPGQRLLFANSAAFLVLALEPHQLDATFAPVLQQLTPLVRDHQSSEQAPETTSLSSTVERQMSRADGSPFRAQLRIHTLLDERKKPIGHAIAIQDLSVPQHLALQLAATEELQGKALTLAAGALCALRAERLGPPTAPLQRLEDLFAHESPGALLGTTLTSLLEILDILTPTETSLRVKVAHEWEVPLRRSDLFLLLGNLILHSVQRTGLKGETSIEATENGPSGELAVVVSTKASRIVEPIQGDPFSALVTGDYKKLLPGEKDTGSTTLGVASHIAKQYGLSIESRVVSAWEGKVRVRFGICQRR